MRCELGRGQLADLAAQTGALAGVSEYNAAELRGLSGREAQRDPGPVRPCARSPRPARRAAADRRRSCSSDGSCPHKRQDLVIRAFARYRRLVPEARLVLVGVAAVPGLRRGAARAWPSELAPGGGALRERHLGRARWPSATAAPTPSCACPSTRASASRCWRRSTSACRWSPATAGAVGEVVGDAGVLLAEDDDRRRGGRGAAHRGRGLRAARRAAARGRAPARGLRPRAHCRGAARRGHRAWRRHERGGSCQDGAEPARVQPLGCSCAA